MSEGFLSRWSRLKNDPVQQKNVDVAFKTAPQVATLSSAGDASAALPASNAEIHAAIDAAETEAHVIAGLPAVDSLTEESDFAAFMQPKVPEALKRQALKKMFTHPHFNVMDGLDIYIDDYTVTTPIPTDWYADMPSWQAILNPKISVISENGQYAVEPDSEEGMAILAKRKAAEEFARADSGALTSELPAAQISPLEKSAETTVLIPAAQIPGASQTETKLSPETDAISHTEKNL